MILCGVLLYFVVFRGVPLISPIQPQVPHSPLQSVPVGTDHCSTVSATCTDIHVFHPRGLAAAPLPWRPCAPGSLLAVARVDSVNSEESSEVRSCMIQKQIAINSRAAAFVAKRGVFWT